MPESLSLAGYEHEAYLIPEYSFGFKNELIMADFCGFQRGFLTKARSLVPGHGPDLIPVRAVRADAHSIVRAKYLICAADGFELGVGIQRDGTYTGSYEHPSYRTCQYLGIHGTVDVVGQDCPIVRLMGERPS